MRRTLKLLSNGIAGFGWLALIAVVRSSLVQTEPQATAYERAAAEQSAKGPSLTEPPIEVKQPAQGSILPSWDVFRTTSLNVPAPSRTYRFFRLPDPPVALPPTQRGDPSGPRNRELAQARYDIEEARYNIRETLNRLEKMGIKVALDWNGTYGTESPVEPQQCLDENWELRWRQTQLDALMEGTPLPRYTPRPADLGRVIPLGWKQCGSGVCNPGNPYCPYHPSGN
jgi:hypothetical protein